MSEKQLIAVMEDLKTAIYTLQESVDKLTAIQTDIFNVDSSHDDTVSLNNRLQSLTDAINKKL